MSLKEKLKKHQYNEIWQADIADSWICPWKDT